jgi:integrase
LAARNGRGVGQAGKDAQINRALAEVATHRYPERDRVMVLLSVKGGLRAKEIAMVTWGMLTDAEGNVGDALHLLNGASKGKKGGRTVPLNVMLRDALIALKARRNGIEPGDRIIHSERDIGMSPGAVQVWFHRLYKEKLGLDGASSACGIYPVPAVGRGHLDTRFKMLNCPNSQPSDKQALT